MASTTKIDDVHTGSGKWKKDRSWRLPDYTVIQPKVRLGVREREEYYLKDILYSRCQNPTMTAL